MTLDTKGSFACHKLSAIQQYVKQSTRQTGKEKPVLGEGATKAGLDTSERGNYVHRTY